MVHPTAIVHPEAHVHPEAEIGPWSVIGKDVTIGKGTVLKSHVVIEGWTTLGENNTVFPFTVLGAVPQDLKYRGERTQLSIGDGNMIRESVTMNLGTLQGGGITSVGSNCLIMAYTHLGHDCRVGNNVVIANAGALAGHAIVEDYATIGGMTGIGQFIRVGAYSYIGGQSGLEKDVPPYAIVVGSRTMHVKGANIVGLRRRGFTADIIQKINEAIKLWARPDIPREQCLLEIESQYGEFAEIQRFIEFIRKSEKGVIR